MKHDAITTCFHLVGKGYCIHNAAYYKFLKGSNRILIPSIPLKIYSKYHSPFIIVFIMTSAVIDLSTNKTYKKLGLNIPER